MTRRLLIFIVALFACDTSGTEVAAVIACDSAALVARGDAFAAGDVAIHLERGGDPLLDPVAADVASYLGRMWNGTFTVVDAQPDFSKKLTIWISTSAAARAQAGFQASSGYAIVRQDPPGGTRVLVVANDAQTLASGTY